MGPAGPWARAQAQRLASLSSWGVCARKILEKQQKSYLVGPFSTASKMRVWASLELVTLFTLASAVIKRSLPEDQNPGIQGSLAVSVVCQPSCRPLAPLDFWILVFGEAALAADLITALKCSFQNQ